jgi:hypothetical protein
MHPEEESIKAKALADPDMDWFRWLIKYWGRKEREINSHQLDLWMSKY